MMIYYYVLYKIFEIKQCSEKVTSCHYKSERENKCPLLHITLELNI